MTTEEKQEAHEEIKAEYTFNMDDLQPVTHRWVDRGEVYSCEVGTHPNHRVFKRQ